MFRAVVPKLICMLESPDDLVELPKPRTYLRLTAISGMGPRPQEVVKLPGDSNEQTCSGTTDTEQRGEFSSTGKCQRYSELSLTIMLLKVVSLRACWRSRNLGSTLDLWNQVLHLTGSSGDSTFSTV